MVITVCTFQIQISIWEERKVFGSRGQALKEELVGRHLEKSNRNGKPSGFKLVRNFNLRVICSQ